MPPSHADQGHHFIRLRLLPRAGPWTDQKIANDAHAYNCPVIAAPITYSSYSATYLSTNSLGVEISSLKIAEEGNEHCESWDSPQDTLNINSWILRVYETLGHKQDAIITLPLSWKIVNIIETDLIEREVSESLTIQRDSSQKIISFGAKWHPHEIKSFKLVF
jgi:alpha-mannosidase